MIEHNFQSHKCRILQPVVLSGPFLSGVGSSGGICKELIKRIGQTSVNFNYEIKIRHATFILEAGLFAKGLSLCVLNGKILFLTKNKIK